ncbi:hypothetical protein NZD89_02220 [Alicyclobacillus fastidiosus]|uniref:Uncharacterized protein n=1 Tax=Alicyclobacillus fastidiosus TaxID=392011 RepID=A0ABY6ZJU2_9BACL|nr:hypothetical protein [Alicyclobacillus fastidiosus]WAH42344.1 hypothetical protein NZD89_02220 [Alicyclobacillus fastidiosus]
MYRTMLFTLLWILTVLLLLFSFISFAGVVARIPALISLVIAVGVTLYRKRSTSWLWIVACIIGILVALSPVYSIVTAHGTSATSSIQATKHHHA